MNLNSFMGVFRRLLLIVFIVDGLHGQEDSLRSALNAIDRRQRDLSDYSTRYDELEYGYPMERPEDLAFLKPSADYNNDREYGKNIASERALLDYLDDDSDRYDQDDVNKRISSSFRERVEEDKQKQMDDLTHNFMSNLESNGEYVNDDEDYEELLRELWDKYQQQYDRPRAYLSGDINKRYYYPKFGLDSIGLRKRSRYFNPDGPNESLYLLNYVPRDEIFNRLQEEKNEDDIDPNYIKNRYFQRDRKFNRVRQGSYKYSQVKRFPVTKRSSDYSHDLKEIHEQKRSTNRKQTDPKVEKDLINIFGSKESQESTTKHPVTTTSKPGKKEQKVSKQKLKSKKEEKPSKSSSSKEEATHVPENEKPLQIKKKSIDWSDYFGLDRRKKSEKNDLDNEWLLERYHKAMAMATKRTAEYPLQSFHNHDQPMKKEASSVAVSTPQTKENLSPEEKRINEMDTKLKNMEDTIVDDALKYTGAHEGVTDSKEIQEVKDKVISRLAAAYSLEKMRNALGEYKLAVAKERERLKHQRKPVDDYVMSAEEKRTSVPRKQAVDEDRENIPETDNNIKCAQGNEDCQEQNYRTPADILENHFGNGECPAIQRACNEVGLILGHYGHIFESACYMHQMCLLCSNNSWFSPTRQCNGLFLEKAYELCKGKTECQRDAQRSVRYLLDVNRSLQSQPLLADECELACPSDSDFMADISDSR